MILNVKGQSLELVGGNVISEGAVEFASFSLECDSSWDNFSKTVRFRHVSQEETYDVAGVVDGKVYYIPAEVLVRGSVFVSVLGVSGESRISTTELAGFFVEGTVDSGKTPTITENAYAQYVDMVEGKCRTVSESVSLAEEYRNDAEEFANIASNVEQNVKKSAESCKDYASFCQKVSGEVSGAEQSMNIALEGVRDSVDTLLSHDHSLSVAENERVARENVREENEYLRKVSENERVIAENKRVDLENERISAERGRIAGENERNARLAQTDSKVKLIENSLFSTACSITGKLEAQTINIDDSASKPPLKFGIAGKCSQEKVPDRDNPVAINTVGKNGSITITHHGKNLIKFPYCITNLRYNKGIWFEPLDDGGVLVYGKTEESKSSLTISVKTQKLIPGLYVLSGGTKECGVYIYDNTQYKYIGGSHGGEKMIEVENETNIEVRIYVVAQTVVDDTVVYPMLRYLGIDNTYSKWEDAEYQVFVPCELLSANNLSDRLTLTEFGGSSRLEKKVEKYTVEGTETVSFVESDGDYNVFSIVKKDGKIARNHNEHEGMGFCNYLPYSNSSNSESCWVQGNEIMLKLSSAEFTDASSVSAFLAKCYADGIPFETVYILRETEIREFSWDGSITLMDRANYLESDSGDIFIEYIKDTTSAYESIIDTLVSLDARVSLLEV